jgi:penicillin-binding protein 1A
LKIIIRYKRIFFFGTLSVISIILILIAFVLSVRNGYFGPLPTYSELAKIEHNRSSRILSAEGKLLGLYYYQNRTNTEIDNIPPFLIDGLIATEDARFYKHNGFDTRSFFRVMIRSILLSDRTSGGGSTISQQLAKNLFPRNHQGVINLAVDKVKEIITARRLERIYSKQQILELYLNTVTFGENTYGIETAALTYFNKRPQDLSINESSLLVGLLKASTGYNPRINKEAAFNRRNTVVNRMVKYKYLEQNVADSLKQLPVELHFIKFDHIEGLAPYFREFLRHETIAILDELNEKFGSHYNIYTDGLTVQTTINASLQAYAEASVKEQLNELQKQLDKQLSGKYPWKNNINLARMQIEQSVPYQKFKKRGYPHAQIIDSLKIPNPTKIFTWNGETDTVMSALDSVLYHFGILQSGMLAIDRKTGNVLAWVGGPNFRYFKYDHVLASRQVGSTIKPLVYASAIEQGVKPCDFYKNDSITYPEFDDWTPKNANNLYGGYYSVQGALVNSVNTISVQLFMETGIEQTILKLKDLGITAPLPDVPSLALGSAEIPLYQMVQAYSVFPNNGRISTLRFIDKILDEEGNVIYEQPVVTQTGRVFSESTAQIMQILLKGVVDRGTASGLRSSYGIRSELGGKTGTTQNQTDGWFIGMTPELIVGVWIGGTSPLVRFRDLNSGQGSRTAMPVFARFVQKIRNDKDNANLLQGKFNISDEIYGLLDCEDYKESSGFFDFLKKSSDPVRRPAKQREKASQKTEEEQTKMGRFLRRVFGTKD